MDNLNDNKFIFTNTQITIFENIIKELKEKINGNFKYKNEIKLYLRKLYSKEIEKYDRLIIHAVYNKTIKIIKEFTFNIIINDSFPKTPPIIFCYSLDNNINLNDRRDLFYSIMENKWNIDNFHNNCIDELINLIVIKIPNFILRLLYYEEKKILIYYGKYYINEVYNINNFLINKNLKLYKVMTYKKDKENYLEQNIKYIIITDIYILFFDLMEGKTKNLTKLIFIGEIFQINNIERLDIDTNSDILNQTNSIFNLDTHKIYIEWVINEESYSFIFSIISEINVNEKKNIIKDNYKNNNEEIIDFINIINKKQNSINIQYKLVISDYNLFESIGFSNDSQNIFSNKILKDLIQLSIFLEKEHKKINNKNKIESKKTEKEKTKEKDLYKIEIFKIYNKIIDIATKINKIEILFDYLDKLESIKKKRIPLFDDDNEGENKIVLSKVNNIKNGSKDNNNLNNKKIVYNKINGINKSNDEPKNSPKENKIIRANTISIKERINKIELNIIESSKKDKEKKINFNKNNNMNNSISALIKIYEKKKD